MNVLMQSSTLAVAGAVLGLALNPLSPRPVRLLSPVYPAAAAGVAQCSAPAQAPEAAHPKTISLAEAERACDACTAGFVDARGAAAYAGGHIAGAYHLPPEGHPDEAATYDALRRHPMIIVYDQGGGCNLAASTAERLRRLGFADVRILGGSWSDWQEAGGQAQSGSCQACEHAQAQTPVRTLGADP